MGNVLRGFRTRWEGGEGGIQRGMESPSKKGVQGMVVLIPGSAQNDTWLCIDLGLY